MLICLSSRYLGVSSQHKYLTKLSIVMKLPCEEAMWYTLPHVRADLARELVKRGMSQKQAADKLGITAAAVSQYLNRKRGTGKNTDPEYIRKISSAVDEIQKEDSEKAVADLICSCCKSSRPTVQK